MSRNKASVDHPIAGNRRAQKMMEQLAEADTQEEIDETDEAVEEVKGLGEIKDLIFWGQNTRTVDAGAYKFTLATLRNKEEIELFTELMKEEGTKKTTYAKTFTLAAAIKKVNGVPFEDAYNGEEDLSSLQKKVFILEQLQGELIELLWSNYQELKASSKELLGSGLADTVKK